MAKRPAKGAGAKPVAVLTEKQEAFALAYVETGNATEAYRRAYDVAEDARDSWIYVEAAQLLDHPKIAPRIEELQALATRLAGYTLRDAASEYEKARELAMAEKNASAAVSAINGKVKLFGLDKPQVIQHTGKDGGPVQIETTVSDDLRSALDAIAGKIAGGDQPG